MDLYDMNHEKVIYTATDFIEFIIEKAKREPNVNVIGCELGGALKNIIAVCAGI